MLSMQDLVDEGLLACPCCRSAVLGNVDELRCGGVDCRYASEAFPVASCVPALVDFERSVLSLDRLCTSEGASEIRRWQFGRRLWKLLHPDNTTARAQVARMLTELRADAAGIGHRPRILVVGGGTVGDGLSEVYDDCSIDLVAFDIYASPLVQFIGDGHAIPLSDGSMDGVVIQAVLEHVLQPTSVAAEIERVLRSDGIVYADSPFLQQVHEGAYDFTRFTDSGHRYLFRHFERIDSGVVAGAGTALRWSIGYFVRALTRSVRLGQIASIFFFWLSLLDDVLDRRHSLDAASSVFFLGRKTVRSISTTEIIDYYQGGDMKRST